jgi:DNA modification methylase
MIKMNLNTIYTGDALGVLQTLPADSVDCCITSPPYFGLRDYGVAGQIGLEETPEAYVARLLGVFREVRRVLKPAGTLWLNIGDSYNGSGKANGCDLDNYLQKSNKSAQKTKPTNVKNLKPKDLIGIPWMMAFALRDAGWYLRQDIVWHKPNPMPSSVKDRCTLAHEYIFLLSKCRKYYYDYKAIMEPAKYAGDNRGARGDARRGTGMNSVSGRTGELRNKRSVWIVNTKPYKGAHFATYPEALIVNCVKAGCPPNGMVLDPFFGAGTAGVVARNLGRNYIGIDLSAEYVEIANKRIRGCDF